MRKFYKNSKINRRAVLIAAGTAAPLLAMLASRADAGAKAPQSAVHYQQEPKDGHDCSHCNHFVAPGGCKLVDGDISPRGWCRLWSVKAA
jgi:hypothetical protein